MKRELKVAKRYASALFQAVSGDPDGIETASADLTVVEEMLANVPYLRAVMMQPLVSDERKRKVIGDAFESRLGAPTLNFLYLLIKKRREDVIDEIIAEYRRMADEAAGRVKAFVETKIALSDDQLKRLRGALEERTGKTVELYASLDDKMLGGMRVRIGDSIIDGSLSGRLEKIHQLLLAAR